MNDSSSNANRLDASEQQVRLFLEQAAPIILESRAISDQHFEQILQLADRLGLSRAQLACELRLLEARGVIAAAPWHLLNESATDHDGPTAAPEPTKDPEPRVAQKPTGKPKENDQRTLAQPPPFSASQAPQASEAAEDGRDRKLRSLVERCLARHPVLTRRDRRKLHRAARRLGLTSEQAEQAMASVEPDRVADEVSSSDVSRPKRRADASDDRRPADVFAEWVARQLSDYAREVLSQDDEIGLIGVGVHRYRLADVLATHVVRDVATERKLRLERDLNVASCHSTADASVHASVDDARLKMFFDKVAPILARFRGINAKSRTLINAVGEELGMSAEELERAILTLQRTPEDHQEDDPHQQERRESFRVYLRRTLAQTQDAVITFRAERRLIEAGEHFHGVAPDWIRPTIREVALEIGARFISEQQAVEHITALVTDVLDKRPVLDARTRTRIYAEGDRWGLEPMDVESILRDRIEGVRSVLAADRRRTRLLLLLTGVGLTAAGLVLSWILLPNLFDEQYAADSERSRRSLPAAAPLRPSTTDWWTEDLRIAMVNARLAHPELKPFLTQLDSPLANVRGRAYEHMIERYCDLLEEDASIDSVRTLMVALYVGEPSAEAADRLVAALFQPLVTLNEKLPASAQKTVACYWSCHTVALIWKHPDLSNERAAELSAQTDSVLHYAPNVTLVTAELIRQFKAVLTRQFYQLVVSTAPGKPKLAQQVYWVIAAVASDCLESSEQDQLDSRWLTAILPHVDDRWNEFDGVIRRLAGSSDPQLTWKLVELYQQSTNGRLKSFLAAEFLERLGIEPGTLNDEELARAMKASLGLADDHRVDERWAVLLRDAKEVLETATDQEVREMPLLQDTVELARLATLAAALVQGEVGSTDFDDLYAQGPASIDADDPPGVPGLGSPSTPEYSVSAGTLAEQYIRNLVSAPNVQQRVNLLQMVVERAPRVRDIDPAVGQLFAAYLVKPKSDDFEQANVIRRVPALTNWNSVLLGLADQLRDITAGDSQLDELYAAVTRSEVDLGDVGGRTAIVRRLLRQVSHSLDDSAATVSTFIPGDDTARIRARLALAESYRFQLRLLISPIDIPAPAEASALLEQIVQQQGARLASEHGSRSFSELDRRWLGELPRTLKAIDFAAESDVQYLCLASDLWLRLLQIKISRVQPARRAAAVRIVDEATLLVPRESTLQRLRRLQAKILQMWMLFGPVEGLPEPVDV